MLVSLLQRKPTREQ